MAETVWGSTPPKPRASAGSYRQELCREVSKETARRYREAYRRAERVSFWKRAGKKAASILFFLSKAAVPFRAAGVTAAYSVAGCLENIRFRSLGKSFQMEAAQATAQKKSNHTRINAALTFIAAGVLIFTASIYRIGLEVILDGESIGYVASENVLESSLSAVSVKAGEILGRPYTISPDVSLRFSVVNKNRLFDAVEVEENLLNSIPDIDRLCVLKIDGEPVAAAWTPADLQNVLNDILASYPSQGQTTFLQEVSIQSQMASLSLLRKPDELLNALTRSVREEIRFTVSDGDDAEKIAAAYGLSVDMLKELNPDLDMDSLSAGQELLIQKAKPFLSIAYTEQIHYRQAVPYITEYVDDDTLWVGETKVVTAGVDGEEMVMATETSIDGYTPDVEVTNSIMLTEPINEVVAVGARIRETTGTFIRPYYGNLTSGFGRRYLFGTYSTHAGIDLAGPIGDPIVASDGGTVVFSGTKAGYGLCVIIDHKNGYTTLYGHCSKLLVKVGQQVGQGELIAQVGNTGRSTGPHVHFEVQVNGVAKNPMNYLKR